MNMVPNPENSGPRDLSFPFRVIAGTLFCLIVVLTIIQVFCRFVLNSPLVWSEELARLSVVWMTFIGAAIVCWDGTHLNVDVLFLHMPSRLRRWTRNFNAAIAVFLLGIIVYYAVPLVRISNRQLIGSFNMPVSVIRVSAVVGCVLMIAFIVLRRIYRQPREKAALGDAFDDSNEVM